VRLERKGNDRINGKKTMPERDENGKFAPGNKGGPGRPTKSKEEKFYRTTLSAVSLRDWREIVKKAVEQAKRGNPAARKWLSDYLLGPPQQRLDVTSGGDKIRVVGVGIDLDKL